MLTEKDLQDIEQATFLLISIVERLRVHNENAIERRKAFRVFTTETEEKETPNVETLDVLTKQGFVEFTEKEITQMPKNIRRLIILDKKRCRLRTRPCGRNGITYQIRYRQNGYNVSACGKTIEIAKERFLRKIRTAKPKNPNTTYVPYTFTEFATYHLENFHKERVTAKHYENLVRLLKRYLAPHFKEKPIEKITPTDCKTVLTVVKNDGKGKTADDLYSLMNGIFKNAIAHGLLALNPLAVVLHINHQRESGSAITRDEEKTLFDFVKGTEFETAIALALFCGLRPNELSTAIIENDFIKAVNSKRKNGKTEYKYIPIIKRLRPFLPKDGVFHIPNLDMLRRAIKNALPTHKLYDLRTTFYTRCDEYGVAPPARDEFVGHSNGTLTNTYRDLPFDYLLKEGKKLNEW